MSKIKKIIPFVIDYITIRARRIYYGIFCDSYSQLQEDILIDSLLNNKDSGFYVDVGANDPMILNNTYRFYSKGWTGINIEPDKLKFAEIEHGRVHDINLNIGIANENGYLTYYETQPDVHSTFSKETLDKYDKKYIKLVDTLRIKVRKLSDVLKEHKVNNIDFMSVDTEGFDLEVLKSNDWKKYRPKIICIEINKGYNSIDMFLRKNGYVEIYNNELNSLYMNIDK